MSLFDIKTKNVPKCKCPGPRSNQIKKYPSIKKGVKGLVKKGKAVKINNEIILDEKQTISEDFFKDNFLKLSLGKKRHIKIELV